MTTMKQVKELAQRKGKSVVTWYNPSESRFHLMIRGQNSVRRFGSLRKAKLYLSELPETR